MSDFLKILVINQDLLQTNDSREILQFHYTDWPDFGIPESPSSFLEFVTEVRSSGYLNLENYGPAVVHCSAGIGRSGTFCLVDSYLILVSSMSYQFYLTVVSHP